MTHRSICAVAFLLTSLAGCHAPSRGPISADAAVRAECRSDVDRQYSAQNRVDLTRRDERDYAYAGSYNNGIPSRGLAAEYQREQMLDGCLRANGDRNGTRPGVGPAFSPVTRGTGGSSLTP